MGGLRSQDLLQGGFVLKQNMVADSGNLFGPLLPYACIQFVTPIVGNINIDIGHILAPVIHEACQIHAVLEGIGVTDPQEETDKRGAGTATNDVRNVEFLTYFDNSLDLLKDLCESVSLDQSEFFFEAFSIRNVIGNGPSEEQ
jgi:hypothetical protein